ncbi:MAG TPA: NAD(P)/FAD-dependent oxidoreductase [Thermodesulfovibrionales bacterium]|nr:NAD(P)/FAD-dependent oxidoreductase [Thermodesulfovibrionales bacterium]
MGEETLYDCIIIGAGPGGLQAAIYLGRFNRKVLLIDREGGRTSHARSIENFLTRKAISGKEIIELGLEQARSFNVQTEKGLVTKVVRKDNHFEVSTADGTYHARFVIVSSGVYDNLPSIGNLYKFLGDGLFTCIDCDGYKTTGRKLVIIGNSIKSVHLAIAMKTLFTKDTTLVLYTDKAPEEYKEVLRDEHIPLIIGRPARIMGDERIEALELEGGERIACEVIMSHFGYKLNDRFLSELGLKKDRDGFKYITSHTYESSMSGLYIVGPLNTGTDQAVIAAGEGAVAALDVNKRLLEF